MNEFKSVESTIKLNNNDFLNQQLSIEISKISIILKEKLEKYKDLESVKKYLSIDATINIIKLHYKDQEERIVDLEREKQQLIDKYKEVREIEEDKKAIRDYKKYQDKLRSYITTKEDVMYNRVEDNIIKVYGLKTILDHLFVIKNSNYLTEEEIKEYINIVKENLTTLDHFEDDEVERDFLITKIYRNPNSYKVEPLDTISSIKATENYYYDETNNVIRIKSPIILDEKLSKREENAFYNEKAYELFGYEKPKENIKVIKGV